MEITTREEIAKSLLETVYSCGERFTTLTAGRWTAVAKWSVCIAGVYLGWKYTRYRIKIYNAWFFNEMAVHAKEAYVDSKTKFFSDLDQLKSKDERLREKGEISLLEIGVGAGANLDYYPEGCLLTAVEPNHYFKEYFDVNRSQYPHIKSTEIIVANGEDMRMISSDSVDIAAVTLVLCSVSNVKMVVDEIYRVLVPGGRFYFMEHIKDWNEKNCDRISRQVWFDRLGFWSFMYDGCKLTRNPMPFINSAGFSSVTSENFYAPIPDVASPHVMGIAIK